jgi:hypothetical protein
VRRPPRPVSRVLGAAIVGLVGVALAPAGCGVSPRPAPLSGFTSGTSSPPLGDGGSSSFFVDGNVPVPTCNLGPDGGVCACADQTLQIVDPPNIYFVLDHSGSMGDGNPTKWQTVVDVIYRLFVDLGPRATFAVTGFPSDDECGPGIEVFPPRQGDAPAGTGGPNATTLIRVLGAIGPLGGTPTAATLDALPTRLQSLPGKTYVVLATDGGPNCNPNAVCGADTCQINIAGDCAAGTNCCTGDPDDCNDADPTIASVQAIAATGIPVYVVGVPGSEIYAQLLDQLATAGNTARSSEPLYYAVSTTDQSALFAALSAIAGRITATCTLTLNSPPADPSLLNVFLDEQPLPQENVADGGTPNWTLSGTTVTILGAACDSIESGTVLDVRVVAGCPTVLR